MRKEILVGLLALFVSQGTLAIDLSYGPDDVNDKVGNAQTTVFEVNSDEVKRLPEFEGITCGEGQPTVFLEDLLPSRSTRLFIKQDPESSFLHLYATPSGLKDLTVCVFIPRALWLKYVVDLAEDDKQEGAE